MKQQPLILKYAEYINESEPTTVYDEDLNLNVVTKDKKKIPFSVLDNELWAQITKTCAIRERDD
ncbi:unnamed protein product [marine sediment metagenome]|uniref:Uncharacterized protein n=1 Tax=marine sediment metagenome TaxID=412755 RepID=X1GBM9_9ZZZZ